MDEQASGLSRGEDTSLDTALATVQRMLDEEPQYKESLAPGQRSSLASSLMTLGLALSPQRLTSPTLAFWLAELQRQSSLVRRVLI